MWKIGMLLPSVRLRGVRAFTLIEILIVVTILAILVGLVLPHVSKSSLSAKANSMLTDLQVIRQQLQAYQVEHMGQYPLLLEMWGNLTGGTDGSGNPGSDFGPYLISEPINPFTDGTVCAADNSADWKYEEATGAIRAVVPAFLIVEMNLSLMDVVAAP